MPINVKQYEKNLEQRLKRAKETANKIANLIKEHKGEAYSINEAIRELRIEIDDSDPKWFLEVVRIDLEQIYDISGVGPSIVNDAGEKCYHAQL